VTLDRFLLISPCEIGPFRELSNGLFAAGALFSAGVVFESRALRAS
jgi:hypothetical protein